jgi:Ca2+-transporting ATPase
VRAVEYGRELYDNLSKYIRFQMAALVGFIATFLGAAIFGIADGIPFSPLAVLWINFVVQVPIAIALGFDKPLPGLMDRKPRPLAQPVLNVPQWVRAVALGTLMAAATLWVRDAFDGWANALIATTMAVTVFSLMNVALGMSARSETRTIFTRDLISDRRQLTLYGGTLIAIILATELDVLNRILDTTSLTGGQWLVCLLLAAGIIAVEEITKLVLRQRSRPPAATEVVSPG